MSKLKLFIMIGVALSLSACAHPTWVREGTSSQQLSMDNAQCKLFAEGIVPLPESSQVSTGNHKRDLVVNETSGLVGGISYALIVRHKYILCMEAIGYTDQSDMNNPQ